MNKDFRTAQQALLGGFVHFGYFNNENDDIKIQIVQLKNDFKDNLYAK